MTSRTLRSRCAADAKAEEQLFAAEKPDPGGGHPEFLATCAEDGERGAAEIFRQLYMTWDGVSNTDRYKKRLLFCADPNLGWHYWDGHHWNPDQSMRVMEAVDGSVKILREESDRQWRLFGLARKEGARRTCRRQNTGRGHVEDGPATQRSQDSCKRPEAGRRRQRHSALGPQSLAPPCRKRRGRSEDRCPANGPPGRLSPSRRARIL